MATVGATNGGITERLARASARRPWLVVGVWVLLFVAGAALASGIGGVLTTEESVSSEPESVKGQNLIDERFGKEPGREFVIVRSNDATVDSPEYRSFVEALTSDISGLTGSVQQAHSYYQTNDPQMVSKDRRTSLIAVALAGQMKDAATTVEPLLDVVHQANGRGGFQVLSAGNGSVSKTFDETSKKDLQQGEMIALPFAIIVLLIVFGAVVAAGIPLLAAIVSIVISVGIAATVGQAFDLSFFVVNMITMIGLAVGVDYSLFVIHRMRDERNAGHDIESAIARTGATASRAVLFSGATVVVALAGLFIVPSSIYRSLAIGAIAVAVVAVAAALTLLPAVLRLLGDRVNALRPPFVGRRNADAQARGLWARTTSLVMAHPLISTAASAALLIAAAVPLLTIQLGMGGVSTLPENTEPRQGFEILKQEFAGGAFSPMKVVIDGDPSDPAVRAAIASLTERLKADGAFSEPTIETSPRGDLVVVSAAPTDDPESGVAHDALNRVRAQYVPGAFQGVHAQVYVTGRTAMSQDMVDLMVRYIPIVFAFVLGLSFLLLLVLFRSIVVPLKAIVMNLLSVGAAYGLLVLVFQRGVGAGLLGFQKSETIEAWLPLFLFAVLFGLSMDYHVFLLSRIKERFDATGDNAGAVAYGMRSTSGLITGAALIMVTVFSGFAMGDLGGMQQMGFGLAVAVMLDATIIRSVLVPASMQLLGELNWYFPRWLAWLPRISIERRGSETEVSAV